MLKDNNRGSFEFVPEGGVVALFETLTGISPVATPNVLNDTRIDDILHNGAL